MKKYSSDTLIYVSSVKIFFTKNETAKNYFLNNIEEKDFYEELCNVAEKNYIEHGIANLTVEQFEELRIKLMKLPIILISGFNYYSLN